MRLIDADKLKHTMLGGTTKEKTQKHTRVVLVVLVLRRHI